MDKETWFHERVIWFSGILSILVIWMHSINSELFLGEAGKSGIIATIEVILSEGVCQIAVPGFFMLSSYLFFRNYDMSKVWKKWESRTRSLLIPFFIWNFLYYIGYVIASKLPWLGDVVGKGDIPFDAFTLLRSLGSYTYNPVFWFVYQLIVLVIISPLIFLAMKKKAIGIILIVVESIIILFGIRIFMINADALFYYTIAAYAAIHRKSSVEQAGDKLHPAIGGTLLGLAFVTYMIGQSIHMVLLVVICRALAPMGIWLLLSSPNKGNAPKVFHNAFFTYAIHFAFVRLINKSVAKLVPGVGAVALILYIIMPILILGISYALATIMKKIVPSAYSVLSGGR